EHDLAHADKVSGDLDLIAIAHHDGRIRSDSHELCECGTSLVHRARLEGVADREEECNCGGLPEVTDENRADCCNGDEEVDADEFYQPRPNRLSEYEAALNDRHA